MAVAVGGTFDLHLEVLREKKKKEERECMSPEHKGRGKRQRQNHLGILQIDLSPGPHRVQVHAPRKEKDSLAGEALRGAKGERLKVRGAKPIRHRLQKYTGPDTRAAQRPPRRGDRVS